MNYEFKFPGFVWIWAFNNLLFVTFAEETLFRGVIQSSFRNRYFGLGIGALLFGLAHYRGGINYIISATFAGLFYGFAYLRTGRIQACMLAHFFFNLTHLIFFTYPASH